MAKYQKSVASPLVLIIPLVIAIIVVIGAVVLSNTKTSTKSKASFSPTEKCVTMCNTNRYVKDKGACALDCPRVAAETMSCSTFCSENITPVTHQDTVGCREANSEKSITKCKLTKCTGYNFAGTDYDACVKKKCGNVTCDVFSSINACKSACAMWVQDPCLADGKVCSAARGPNLGQAKSQCKTSCNLVKADTKTCSEVMTAALLSAVLERRVPSVLNACKNYFE